MFSLLTRWVKHPEKRMTKVADLLRERISHSKLREGCSSPLSPLPLAVRSNLICSSYGIE